MSSITLKWGTLKGWEGITGANMDLLKAFMDGAPMSAMMDRPDAVRKTILCDLIDGVDTVHNDWTGKDMTKDEAKQYVLEYGS